MVDPAGKPVKNGAVIANEEGKVKDGFADAPQYDSVKDVPTPTTKQVRANAAEREAEEGMAAINGGWAPGLNPNAHRPSRQNPNSKYDPKTKKFIPGTGYYDLPRQRPIPNKE